MFERVADIFRDKLESLVEKTKINVAKREREFDFSLLGRSLSINPYPPRAWDFDFSLFVRDGIIRLDCIRDESSLANLSNNLIEGDSLGEIENLGLIVADTTSQKDISLVTTLRRYSPFIIIHKDIIISKYQVLESVVYGADMIVLDADILDSNALVYLANFANYLGLRVVINSPASLPSEILEGFDFVMIDNARTKIPQNKIAMCLKH